MEAMTKGTEALIRGTEVVYAMQLLPEAEAIFTESQDLSLLRVDLIIAIQIVME